MPLFKYTFEIEGRTLSEEDRCDRETGPKDRVASIISHLNASRKELGEPQITLKSVTVTNPHVHEHSWTKGRKDTFALRAFYYCSHCNITGYRILHLAKGEISHCVHRDDKFKSDKYELCKDQLKPVPKTISFQKI